MIQNSEPDRNFDRVINAQRLIDLFEQDMLNGRVLFDGLSRYARAKLGDFHLGEDAVSQFYHNQIKGGALQYAYRVVPGGFFENPEVRPYSYTCVGNLCIDIYRKRVKGANKPIVSDDSGEEYLFFSEEKSPLEIAAQNEIARLVQTNLSQLNERDRKVLRLHYYEQLGYEEIADSLKIPVGTVRSRIFVAKTNLLRTFADYPVASLI